MRAAWPRGRGKSRTRHNTISRGSAASRDQKVLSLKDNTKHRKTSHLHAEQKCNDKVQDKIQQNARRKHADADWISKGARLHVMS
jgi:hypothetical protein